MLTRRKQDDRFIHDACQMALVHNVIIRAFNGIYLQATHVRSEDVTDFLHYCSAWHTMLKGHHDGEEEVYFPGIEKATGIKGLMDSEVDEHGEHSPKSHALLAPESIFRWSLAN